MSLNRPARWRHVRREAPPTGRKPARGARLRLEPLEDRSVPATFFVTTTLDESTANGKRSLREAITAANADPGADTIVVPAGVFKMTLGAAGEDDNAGGDFDVKGKVTIVGAGVGFTVIDAQKRDRAFDVIGTTPGSIEAVFRGLTIRNGSVTGHGGGIRVGNADLVVRGAAVTGNRATATGGGISNAVAPGTGDVTLVRSTVGGNLAGTNGGGIFVDGASSLTVRNGVVRANVCNDSGGGLFAHTASLTDTTVTGNTGRGRGGGIYVSPAGTATLTNSAFRGNFSYAGGGIYVEPTATATLTGGTVNGNTGYYGGGIVADTAELTRVTVSGNFAGLAGGGIYVGAVFVPSAGTVTVSGCTFSANTTSGDGGGLFVDSQGRANLTGSTISGNRAEDGGGITIASTTGPSSLTNCTISGNTASHEGGGVWAYNANLLNCTVVQNIAGNAGGGLFHGTAPVASVFSVRNTIVALNSAGVSGPDVAGVIFTSQGHNLIGNSTGGTGFGATGDIVGDSASPIDPRLGPLANNGGPTRTHRLLAGSPAVDAGDNTDVPTTDQRGFPRIKDGNGDGNAIVDIGAFER